METQPPFGDQTPIPSIGSQISFLQDLESRLRVEQQIPLRASDISMINGIYQSILALRLILQVDEMKQTKG
jgi:hypothetical protein